MPEDAGARVPTPPLPRADGRVLRPERMDDPTLDAALHLAALRGLSRLHRLAGTVRSFVPGLLEVARRRGAESLDVLDVACGGGDVGLGIARAAARRGVRVRVLGLDKSEVALECARRRAEDGRFDARFEACDVLRPGALAPQSADLVVASLFLHHLEAERAAALLAAMAAATRDLLLVQDLLRTRLGYLLAWAASRVATRSAVVREDALLSVAAAFSLEEARGLARDAGLEGASVTACWPERFVLRWRRT